MVAIKNLKEKRKALGLTQMYMASEVGICLLGYQLIERGITKKPATKTIEKIKGVLKSCLTV